MSGPAAHRLRLAIGRGLHALVGSHTLYEAQDGRLPIIACRFCDVDRYRRGSAR